MDTELLDIFAYKLLSDIPLMQENITALKNRKKESTAQLFRNFHNFKASSSYLGLSELSTLVSQGENILNTLRFNEAEISDIDITWLNACVDQLKTWADELLVNAKLTPINSKLFPSISIISDTDKTADIMQGLSILYADTNHQRSLKIQAPLEHIFKSVQTTDSFDDLKTSLLNNLHDIVILNMEDKSIEIAYELLKLKPDIALITAIPELKEHQKSRLLLKGLTHPILSPIKAQSLKRQLHNIITSHFAKVYSLVSHKTIYSFIQALDPLSSSIKEIADICNNPEASIKELITAVESDPITTTTILHAISLPIYGLNPTSSVDQAVSAFGKRTIKALVLSDLAYQLGSLSLSAYEVNEEQFKQTSRVRLALMTQWYTRVNVEDLDILASSAILGNLGSILINQELLNQNLESDFKASKQENITQAEVKLLKTSSAFVTADILEFWGLEADLIDSIRYSDSPFNASSQKSQQLACANAVVYKMVNAKGEILKDIPESVKEIMNRAHLNIERLEEVVNSLSREGQEE